MIQDNLAQLTPLAHLDVGFACAAHSLLHCCWVGGGSRDEARIAWRVLRCTHGPVAELLCCAERCLLAGQHCRMLHGVAAQAAKVTSICAAALKAGTCCHVGHDLHTHAYPTGKGRVTC